MNSWYFTFEYPPEFGGGLSTYMRVITDAHVARPDDHLCIFTLSGEQDGLLALKYLHDNVVLISINPKKTPEDEELGHWVNVSRLFDRISTLILMQIETGMLNLPQPDYLEFADGFGIGAITIQQKLCLNSQFQNTVIGVTAHTPTYIIDRLDCKPVYALPRYHTAQMELQALMGADIVFSPSQAVIDEIQKDLTQRGSELKGVRILRNPYVPERPPTTQENYDSPKDHFFMASRLAHWKGAEDAIKALRKLWDKGIQVPFHIFGEDTWLAERDCMFSEHLQKTYAPYLDEGLIRLHGKVPRAYIDQQTKTAYAQLHPSHFDNFPYAILEAMAEGKICIAGTNGGIKEIATHGEEIFLTDIKDPDIFAAILEHVISLTPSERRTIGDRASACIETNCDANQFLDSKKTAIKSAKSKPVSQVFPFLTPAKTEKLQKPEPQPTEPPLLSVIIPYYNMGLYVDETISSVLAATAWNDLEIILVNDGSTDPRSVAHLKTLHEAHDLSNDKLRIINTENRGVASARNTGVSHSEAPFVALLDADDCVHKDYYAKALNILKHYSNVSFVGCWNEDFNSQGKIRFWATWNAEPPIPLIMNQTNCQSLVYKRRAYQEAGQHDPSLNMFLDDWEGVISLLAAGHRGVMIPEPLFSYRIRHDSIFRSGHTRWTTNYEKITQKHKEFYREWGPDVTAFFNANGPNRFYHIAGKKSALV